MTMADRVAVLREGVIQQIDHPENVYHRPANRFVATVVGSPPMNFIPATATAEGGTLKVAHERFALTTSAPGFSGGQAEKLRSGSCWVGVRPEDVHVVTDGGEGLDATVYVTEPLGGETVVDLSFGDRVVKALAPPTLSLTSDQAVRIRIDPKRMHVFTEDGEALLSAAGDDIFTLDRR
jgi:multiple sugar transport system ATP-binding protein